MKLKPEDAALFYELFFPLLDYVNASFRVTVEDVQFISKRIDPRDAAEVARYLWERTSIIDDYVAETKLPAEHKGILLGWKRCIRGTFIIKWYLKKGSVFISTNNSVYLVNGIIDSGEEMLQNYPTPLIVKATLLPFKNVIISDGLVSTFPIRFGRNSAAEFKEIYMSAKQNHSIITRPQ